MKIRRDKIKIRKLKSGIPPKKRNRQQHMINKDQDHGLIFEKIREMTFLLSLKVTSYFSLQFTTMIFTNFSYFLQVKKRKKAHFKISKGNINFTNLLKVILLFEQIKSSNFWKGRQLKPRTSVEGKPNHTPMQKAGSN